EEITHDYVMDHCVIHGSVNKVVDQILALREEIGDFGELVYAGMDWVEPALNKRSMQLMAEEDMPRVNAAIVKSATAAGLPVVPAKAETQNHRPLEYGSPRKREPIIAGLWNMGPRLRGDDIVHRTCSAAGNAIQVRSRMLRWQASANATSRMPAAKSHASGASAATWRRNASQPTR